MTVSSMLPIGCVTPKDTSREASSKLAKTATSASQKAFNSVVPFNIRLLATDAFGMLLVAQSRHRYVQDFDGPRHGARAAFKIRA